MLLAVDIGNTNSVLGTFEGEECTSFRRISSDSRRTEDEYAVLLHNLFERNGVSVEAIDDIVIGSVVPVLSNVLGAALQQVIGREPFHVTHSVRLPVKNRYANPDEVGIDRLANAAGGVRLYGAPLIVVDLGTAVTLDIISDKKEYVGGTILPGIEMSAEALSRRTARLPLASLEVPPRVIGRTTIESIRSGILYGLIGAIDSMIERIWKELGCRTNVVATGGLAPVVLKHSRFVKHESRDLTLRGLKYIWETNRRRRK